MLLDPPNYTANDDHRVSIAYDVYNYSCATDITAVVALTGTVTGTTVATSNVHCADSCVIPAGGLLRAAPYWELLYHPAANGEKIKATVTIAKPDDFSDADADNNADTSPEHINIIALDDIVTSLGTREGNKGLLTAAPAPFSFGAVDIELASARIASSLPYELSEASVAVAITNRGAQPEPVTALIDQEPRCRPPPEPEPLHQSDLVIGAGKTANFTLKLPTDSLPVGRQSLTVLLCAVNNRAENRSITLNFTRRPPTVDAEIVSIAARPARSTMRGLPVEIRVTMRNNGSKERLPSGTAPLPGGGQAAGTPVAPGRPRRHGDGHLPLENRRLRRGRTYSARRARRRKQHHRTGIPPPPCRTALTRCDWTPPLATSASSPPRRWPAKPWP